MKTILVIEDDKEICQNIKQFLEREYRVYTSFSGKGGLDILKNEPISLVVLDYMLPDIEGLEVLSEIRKNHKTHVIMITAFGDKEIVLKSWRYKADYYFDKPFKLRELREKIQELLKFPNSTFPFDIFGLNPFQLSPEIRKALEFIGSSLASPKGHYQKITLKEISAITSLSPKYLSFLFNKESGRSINQIINMLKIEKAKELLQNEEKDIKEISHGLGFKHPNNFSCLFKKLTGRSPSEFKK